MTLRAALVTLVGFTSPYFLIRSAGTLVAEIRLALRTRFESGVQGQLIQFSVVFR
jgi:hypothetical protein